MRLIQNRGGLRSTGCWTSTVLLFVLVLCLDASDAQAQWEPEVRLTNAPDSSLAHEWYTSLAVSGSSVHVVWADKRSGDWEIYYKRSVDDGVSWGEDILLSANGSGFRPFKPYPSIAVSGSSVHVVWHNDRTGNFEIYHRRSMDGGKSWDAEECLFDDRIMTFLPSVAVLGNTVHIAWSDARVGNMMAVYHMRSTDDGYSWGEAERISGTSIPGAALGARMSVSDDRIYVSWYYYWAGMEAAWYQVSTDGGVSWCGETHPGAETENTTGLAIQQSAPYVYCLWMEKSTGMWNLRYRHSSDAGMRWSDEGSLKVQQIEYPRFSFAGSKSTIHLVHKDDVNGLGVIYYECSTDAGEHWNDPVDLSPFPTKASYPSIAVSGTTLHAIWTDYRDGAGEIYYRRNPTGNPVSVESHTPLPADIALDQNFPNPFRGSSSVRFAVPQRSHVILTLHDLLGRRVTTLREGEAGAGSHHARIDASGLPAGSYLLRLSCEGQQRTRLITVLR